MHQGVGVSYLICKLQTIEHARASVWGKGLVCFETQDFNAAGTNTDQNWNKRDIQDMLNSIS